MRETPAIVTDIVVPAEDQIHAALDDAINRPLAHLLEITEFAEKYGSDMVETLLFPPAMIDGRAEELSSAA